LRKYVRITRNNERHVTKTLSHVKRVFTVNMVSCTLI